MSWSLKSASTKVAAKSTMHQQDPLQILLQEAGMLKQQYTSEGNMQRDLAADVADKVVGRFEMESIFLLGNQHLLTT